MTNTCSADSPTWSADDRRHAAGHPAGPAQPVRHGGIARRRRPATAAYGDRDLLASDPDPLVNTATVLQPGRLPQRHHRLGQPLGQPVPAVDHDRQDGRRAVQGRRPGQLHITVTNTSSAGTRQPGLHAHRHAARDQPGGQPGPGGQRRHATPPTPSQAGDPDPLVNTASATARSSAPPNGCPRVQRQPHGQPVPAVGDGRQDGDDRRRSATRSTTRSR